MKLGLSNHPEDELHRLCVIAAILSIAGPVTTYRSFTRSSRRFKSITAAEYDSGTKMLADNNMGKNVTIRVPYACHVTNVFIKLDPGAITENQLLTATGNLMSLEKYTERFFTNPDAHAITAVLKKTLIEEGHVPENFFIQK